MKWIIWTLAIVALLPVSVVTVFCLIPEERQVGEDILTGLTTKQVRDRYGAPDVLIPIKDSAGNPEELWVYYRNRVGGGTGITFRKGIVDDVETRGAQ